MTHVIIHAGFHKTGTTSLQSFMSQNKSTLKPYCDYYGKQDFLAAGTSARVYSQKPFPWRLYKFRKDFRHFLSSIQRAKTIIISRETFTGSMPGHRNVFGKLIHSYQTPARRLAKVIVSELRRRFGEDVNITFYYTTREKEEWIKSVYGHLLRSIKLTQTFDEFRNQFLNLKSPEEEAILISKSLTPIPVVISDLKINQTLPFGPASKLIELINVPENIKNALAPAKISHIGQSQELRDEMLRLNRSVINRNALKREKRKLLSNLDKI